MTRINGGITVLPHVQAFADALVNEVGPLSIGTYLGHQPTPQRALDIFHRIGDHATADRICDFALANMRRFGIDYVISRQRIYNPEIAGYWRGMEDRGSATQNHEDHVHISFEVTGGGGGGSAPTTPAPKPQPPKEDVMFSISPPDTGHLVNLGTRKLLDIATDVNNASNVGVWVSDGQADQRWQVWHHGAPPGGRHEVSLVSRAKNKALDSPGGTEIWVWDSESHQANQRFVILDVGGAWVIEHPHRDGLVLGVDSDGYTVSLQTKSEDANQRWLFVPSI